MVPIDITDNLKFRIKTLDRCVNDAVAQEALFRLCDSDILSFFRILAWTYDPRKTPSDRPFIPFPYQEQYILDINNDIEQGNPSVTEKSRDMGVTWCVLTVFFYRWAFKSENFLVGSKKEDAVDTIGDIGSHFERFRYMLSKMPSWLCDRLGIKAKNSGSMRIWKDNGAALVGESMAPGFSRQGRHNAILLDEFAFVDKADLIYRACGDSAPCRIAVSTPNGKNNFFAKLRFGGKVKVYTHHWKSHPGKGDAWYESQKGNRSDKDIAQELDINYTVSAGDPFYIGFSRGMHVKKMEISTDKDLILGFDYGFTHPNCTIHQLSAEGILIIVDNIFGENQTIDEFGEHVKSYLNANWPGYKFGRVCYGDPAGNQRGDKSKKSSVEVLADLGFKVLSMPSNSALGSYANRKNIIEKRLRTIIRGIPSLVINDVPNNEIFAEGFEGGYCYPDADKYGGTKEHPIHDDYFSHPFNCLEYVCINLFRPVEKNEQRYNSRIVKRDNVRRPANAGFGF
jgi:hypothetical protein